MATSKPPLLDLLEKRVGSDNNWYVNYAVSESCALDGAADSRRKAGAMLPREPRVGLRGGRRKSHPTVDRFWARVKRSDTTSCWLVQGRSKSPAGHVHFHDEEGWRGGAHRYSWRLHRGPIPDGMVVCHTCDVPACVNPDHLFLGTQWDNVRDSRLKGHRRGMQRLT